MPAVYILTGPKEGQNVVLMNRYKFVEGAMVVSDEDADLMSANMEFYHAKRISVEQYEAIKARKRAEKSIVNDAPANPVKAALPK